MTMLPMKTGPGMMSPGAGGMTPRQMGLLGLGIGLLSGNPRTQGLAGGLQAYGQANSPQAAMQRQMMQMQMAELQRKAARDKAYENLILGIPTGGAAGQAATTPSMVEPALGGSLVDMPGGGVEPGQVQTAMMPPPQATGGLRLPEGITPEMMLALGPERGAAFLAQTYKPGPAAKPTSVMLNAEALGLKRGTPEYNEYVRAATLENRGTQVNIRNEGTIPPGFRAVRGPEGNILRLDPIPGGPAAQEIAAGEEAKAAQQAERQRTGDIVTQDIDTVLGQIESGFPVTGVFSAAAAVPGTKAHDVAKTLDAIKANIGFDKLQAMRAASPTGGALGQVSERENVLLQSTFGSLAQSQSEEQFRRNLTRLRETYLDIIHGKGNRPSASGQTGQGVSIDLDQRLRDDPSSLTDEELRELAR